MITDMTIEQIMAALYQLCPEVNLQWNTELNQWFVLLPKISRSGSNRRSYTSFTCYCEGLTTDAAIHATWAQVTQATMSDPLVKRTPDENWTYYYWTGYLWKQTF